MTWETIATIQTLTNWSLTDSVAGTLFRVKHTTTSQQPSNLRAVICQVIDEIYGFTIFDTRRLAYKEDDQAYIFIQPAGIINRKLAIKRLDNLPDDWIIEVDTLDGMPYAISLPLGIDQISGLEEELSGKATAIHNHAIADVADLESELDDKAPASHNHAIADVADLESELDSKAPVSHNHVIANISGLQSELNDKAAVSHNHVIANISGLQSELDGKAATSHTHTLDNLDGTLSITKGGTGASTKNFADLSTAQNVGGAKTFIEQLTVRTDSLANPIIISSSTTALSSPGILLQRSAGTTASPQPTTYNATLGALRFGGYESINGYVQTAAISAVAMQTFSGTEHGTQLNFYTTQNGSTTTSIKMILDNGGNLGVGTTTPGGRVQIVGGLNITSSTSAASDPGAGNMSVVGNCKANSFQVEAMNGEPNSPTATGTLGQIRFTPNYIYLCVATNTWKRVAILSWIM